MRVRHIQQVHSVNLTHTAQKGDYWLVLNIFFLLDNLKSNTAIFNGHHRRLTHNASARANSSKTHRSFVFDILHKKLKILINL